MTDKQNPGADAEELSEQDLEYVTEELADETAAGLVGGGDLTIGEAGQDGGAGILGEAGPVGGVG